MENKVVPKKYERDGQLAHCVNIHTWLVWIFWLVLHLLLNHLQTQNGAYLVFHETMTLSYLYTFPSQSLNFVLKDTFCQGSYILLLLKPADTHWLKNNNMFFHLTVIPAATSLPDLTAPYACPKSVSIRPVELASKTCWAIIPFV